MRKFTILSYEIRDDGLSFDDDLSNETKEDRQQQVIQQFEKLENEMKKHSYRNVVIFFPELSSTTREKFLDIVENCFTRIEKIKFISAENCVMLRTLRFVALKFYFWFEWSSMTG
jgi:hypothetical protein